jgi:flagellar motor switch protein FliG
VIRSDNLMDKEIKTANAFDLGDLGNKNNKKVIGSKKAAVLLMTLGPEVASEIIKRLPESQIQRIGVEIANIGFISSRERREILQEFIEINKAKDFVIEGGIGYAKSLLSGALGSSRANKILEGIKHEAYLRPFMTARKSDVDNILNAIRDESPQTIAIILANIQPEKAAQVLIEFPPKLQNEVALKIGSISNISPAVIKTIDEALEKKLSMIDKIEMETSGGVDALVDILVNVDRKTEKSIIGSIEEKDTTLADQIKANMFVFEDIVKLDNLSIQKILKEVNLKDLAFALKASGPQVAESIYRNQSNRASEALKEEIDLLGPIKVSQVEEAQQNIVNVIRKLEEEGVITIARSAEDEFIV